MFTTLKYRGVNGHEPRGQGVWWFRFYRVMHNGEVKDVEAMYTGFYANAKRQARQRIAREGWSKCTVVEVLP